MNDTPKIETTPEHVAMLDGLAARYSKAREKLGGLQADLESEVAAIRRSYRVRIKEALQAVLDLRHKLVASIQARPGTFDKPRTRTLHGIQLGFRKQKGKITWAKGKGEADKIVARIKRLFPEQAALLINTKEVPNKDALQAMAAADLKKLGVTIVEAGDEVVCKDAARDLDKLIDALLEGDGDDGEED